MINEAYEVLGDKKKRELYDLQGDNGSTGQAGGSGGGHGYAGQNFQQPGGGAGFTFHSSGYPGGGDGQWFDPTGGAFSSPSFGGAGGFGGFGGGPRSARGTGGVADILQEFMDQVFQQGGGAAAGMPPNMGASGASPHFTEQSGKKTRNGGKGKGRVRRTQSSAGPVPDAKPATVTVDCSLEDLYHGKTKNLKVKDRFNMGSQQAMLEKVYKVEVKPGYKAGTKVKFPASQEFPKPVEFEIRETPHKYFVRRGDDLLWTAKLTARQLEKGVLIRVPLLDGTTLSFDSKKYQIKAGSKVPFAGKGMPVLSKRSSGASKATHGDLIVQFEIS